MHIEKEQRCRQKIKNYVNCRYAELVKSSTPFGVQQEWGKRRSRGGKVAVTWRSRGSHVVIEWQSRGVCLNCALSWRWSESRPPCPARWPARTSRMFPAQQSWYVSTVVQNQFWFQELRGSVLRPERFALTLISGACEPTLNSGLVGFFKSNY